MCVMRLPAASRQPFSGQDILLSWALPSTHPSSSGCNHPSENATSMESEGSAPVHWQTRKEITYHSQRCDCRILPVSPVSSRKVSKLLFFPLILFHPFSPSEHKMKMRSPLSSDNFPGVKPIERYRAVSNLSGKVLERYSRMLDVHV